MPKNHKFRVGLQFIVMLLCLLGLSGSAMAQKKPAKKPAAKSSAKPAAASAASLVVREQTVKVANQIKTLTKFIYLLGGAAKPIEDMDKEIRAGKATPNGIKINQSNKQIVLTTIKNVRAGVVQLEGEFHSKPELRPYIIHIQGVSEMAGMAEEQATNGQIDAAGKTLIEVVNRLTDALRNLR